MKSKSKDALPVRVPFSAIPTGETPDIRRWAQPAVWSDRMLTTLLEDKVKGGKWHALIDKVYAPLNLYTAARKVTSKRKAAGVDGQSCEKFEEHLVVETQQLSEEIKAQTYRPSSVLRVHIPKPGRTNELRPLGIPTVRDRAVQARNSAPSTHHISILTSAFLEWVCSCLRPRYSAIWAHRG